MQNTTPKTYDYPQFTEEMRRDYTILVPNMLPVQLGLICRLMRNYGYKMELLHTEGPNIAEQGLRNVHNDTCYPALLVIGQLIDAIQSGRYDVHKIALILPQTGGGCRASNYIHLLRKALEKNGYGFIPVISLNFSGLESNPGFKLTKTMLMQVAYALLIGDLIMMVANQCRPYEIVAGSTDKAIEICMDAVTKRFTGERVIRYGEVKHLFQFVLDVFGKVRLDKTQKKKLVGIVGEIYVKFSPLGNNRLEEFLLSEGCEPVLPGLMDFCLYCIYNSVIDHDLYSRNGKTAAVYKMVYQFVLGKQADIIKMMKKDGHFRPPMPFDEVRKSRTPYRSGCQDGRRLAAPRRNGRADQRGRDQHRVHPAVRLPAEPHRRKRRHQRTARQPSRGEYHRRRLRSGCQRSQSAEPYQTDAFHRTEEPARKEKESRIG